MLENPQDHPLHGVSLEAMIVELVQHYDWDILAAQIPLQCFGSYPSVKSSIKFLKKTRWARERLEAFYLYRFKNLPLPNDEQHELPPRERNVDLSGGVQMPAVITLSDREFFDDPISGPKPPSSKAVDKTQARVRQRKDSSQYANTEPESRGQKSETKVQRGPVDPWAKWKALNKKS